MSDKSRFRSGGVQDKLDIITIDCGCTDCGDVQPNGILDYNIYYTKTFSQKPIVTANIYGTYHPISEMTGPNIIYSNKDYFTIRVKNSYRIALNVKINWIAVL